MPSSNLAPEASYLYKLWSPIGLLVYRSPEALVDFLQASLELDNEARAEIVEALERLLDVELQIGGSKVFVTIGFGTVQ